MSVVLGFVIATVVFGAFAVATVALFLVGLLIWLDRP